MHSQGTYQTDYRDRFFGRLARERLLTLKGRKAAGAAPDERRTAMEVQVARAVLRREPERA